MEALSSNLLLYIFEFLSLKDYQSLITTCRGFSHAILNHNKFWIRECLTKYLSFDLELYSETYECEDYKSYIRNKIQYLQKNAWKQLLEEGEAHKKAMAMVLTNIAAAEDVESFMNDFCQTLKEPNLPMANLKRETIICTTQTFFQAKLSEVLYENTNFVSKNGCFFDCSLNIIDQLKDYEKRCFQEMLLHDRNEIHKARWYNFEHSEILGDLDETVSFGDKSDMLLDIPELPDLTKISNVSTEDLQATKSRNTLLINLYDALCNSLKHYCGVVHQYLSSLDDVYLLISEYSARWKLYVCTMLELEKKFTAFTELLNAQYETIFEGYPCFPKFSIWRLMTKIWMKEVYEKSNLNRILIESFLKILSNYRESYMKETFNNSFSKVNIDEEEVSELPKSLYIGLKVMRQKSFHCQYNANLTNAARKCFRASPETERDLLSSFLQSVLDVSLNEVNIHYLDCTDIPVSYPYCELEEAILYQSNDFYQEYQQLFYESPEYFTHLLKADSTLLSSILIQKSTVKLERLQQEKGVQVIQQFIAKKVEQIDEEQLRKDDKPAVLLNEQADEITDFIENCVRQVLEEKNCCCQDLDIPELPELPELGFGNRGGQFTMEEEVEETQEEKVEEEEEEFKLIREGEMKKNIISVDKSTIRVIVAYLEALPSNFRQSLEYIKQRTEYLQSIKEKDECIRLHNTEKNIPCEMGDVDTLFYDLGKTVGISLLEKLYEDYQVMAKQQRQEEEAIAPEGQDINNNDNMIVQNENMGPNFVIPDFMEDFDNVDLMSLGELSLRRALT